MRPRGSLSLTSPAELRHRGRGCAGRHGAALGLRRDGAALGFLLLSAVLRLLAAPAGAAAEPSPSRPPALQHLPIGTRCRGLLPCELSGDFGIHARLLAALSLDEAYRLTQGLLVPSLVLSMMNAAEVGIALPLRFYDVALPVPERLRLFGQLSLPKSLLPGAGASVFASGNLALGPFNEADAPSGPRSSSVDVGGALGGELGSLFHVGTAAWATLGPAQPELHAGLDLSLRTDYITLFAQAQVFGPLGCVPTDPACASGLLATFGLSGPWEAVPTSAHVSTGRGAAPSLLVAVQGGLTYLEEERRREELAAQDDLRRMDSPWAKAALNALSKVLAAGPSWFIAAASPDTPAYSTLLAQSRLVPYRDGYEEYKGEIIEGLLIDAALLLADLTAGPGRRLATITARELATALSGLRAASTTSRASRAPRLLTHLAPRLNPGNYTIEIRGLGSNFGNIKVGYTGAEASQATAGMTEAESLLKLNLGSGQNPMEGAINLDVIQGEAIDVRGNVEHLPFATASFDEVHAINPHGYSPVTPEVARVLKPGGSLKVTGTARNGWAKVVTPEQARAAGFEIIEVEPMVPEHVFGIQKTSSGGTLKLGTSQTITYRKLE